MFSGSDFSSPTHPKCGDERVLTFRCSNCDRLVVVLERVAEFKVVPDVRATRAAIAAGLRPADRAKREAVWSVCGSWPLTDGEPPDYVPDHIGALYREAAVTLSAGCYRAATVMIRGAMDAAVSDKGATGESLYKKIESMKGTLRAQLIDIADTLRLGGNDAAHDFTETWDQEEAAELFRFLDEVLRELYETPIRIDRVKRYRDARARVSSTGTRS